MFIHAFLSQNSELYSKIYPEDFGMSPEEEAEMDFYVPQSEEEALAMFADLDAEIDGDIDDWRSTPLML